MDFINLPDKYVGYAAFLKDVAATVVYMVRQDADDPEFISQRRAFAIFGRRNVERWRKNGLVECFKRPGKVEFRTADLRLLQRCSHHDKEKSGKKHYLND